MNPLVGSATALLSMLLAGAAHATPDDVRQRFERSYDELAAVVLDARGSFSYSATYPKLEATEALARQLGDDTPELARILDLMSLVRMKHDDYAEALALGKRCLALHGVSALPPERRILLLHRVASANEKIQNYLPAERDYRAVLAFDATHGGQLLDEDQRLGIRQQIGYLQHESGHYAEAAAGNQALLADGERRYGRDDRRLIPVLINLAQNHYELGAPERSRAVLERVLTLARANDDADAVDNALFQLGVLAFEAGNDAAARASMAERILRAKLVGDAERASNAEADTAELERRIAARKKD